MSAVVDAQQYSIDVERVRGGSDNEALASSLCAVLQSAPVAVRSALESGWFQAPSEFFCVPSSASSYRLRDLMRLAEAEGDGGDETRAFIAPEQLDELDDALSEYARSLASASAVVEAIELLDAAGFGIVAAPLVAQAHQRLEALQTREALRALSLNERLHNDNWRVWSDADDSIDGDESENKLLRKQALVANRDIARVWAPFK